MNALVHLTHDCNLRCPYCFTGAKLAREMTVDTAKRTAEFVVDYAKEHGQRAVFSFFGGEPMMAWDVMRELVLHAESVAAARGVTAIFAPPVALWLKSVAEVMPHSAQSIVPSAVRSTLVSVSALAGVPCSSPVGGASAGPSAGASIAGCASSPGVISLG